MSLTLSVVIIARLPLAVLRLLAFFVAFVAVLFQYRASRNFFSSFTVAARPFRRFLDMFVLALLLVAYASNVLLLAHRLSPFLQIANRRFSSHSIAVAFQYPGVNIDTASLVRIESRARRMPPGPGNLWR